MLSVVLIAPDPGRYEGAPAIHGRWVVNPGRAGARRFDVTTTVGSSELVVGVSGEVDLLTAPLLGGVLGALVAQGQSDLVVDLAEVSFLDAAGLGAITGIVASLGAVGGRLRVVSPLAPVRRVFEITSLDGLLDPTAGSAMEVVLGSEQARGDGSVPGVSPSVPATLAAPSPVVGPTAETAVVDAALRLVTALTQATVGGADGVSVSLTRHGRLTTVAATDETIAQMDRDQYAAGEGPCLAAAAEGRWFHVDALAEEDRWPTFVARAVTGGIGSILSTPLMVTSLPVGALNIYSHAERAFGPEDQELAALFAAQASTILVEGPAPERVATAASRLRAALEGRTIIAQAQGVVMARQGLSAEQAFASLLHSARETEMSVLQRADAVVAGTVRDGLIGQVGS